jgi:hypothetical protein
MSFSHLLICLLPGSGLLMNVSDRLKPGGFFVGTMTDAAVIV